MSDRQGNGNQRMGFGPAGQWGSPTQAGDGSDLGWATTDDLVNSIVGATSAESPTIPELGGSAGGNVHGEPPVKASQDVTPSPAQRGEYGTWQQGGTSPAATTGPADASASRDWADTKLIGEHDEASGNRRPNGDKAGRRGRFTSGIALILATLAAVAALSPVITPVVNESKWIISFIMSLPMTAVISLPAILLGLRSATKPDGQLGKRRGIAAIVICSVAVCLSAVLFVSYVFGVAHSLNEQKITAKEQTDPENMTILFPGGQVTLSNNAIKVLMKAGVLPDNTLDRGAIPISSANGKVYVGSQELSADLVTELSNGASQEASEETLREIADMIKVLANQSITVTTDGDNITLRFTDGTMRTITRDDLVELRRSINEVIPPASSYKDKEGEATDVAEPESVSSVVPAQGSGEMASL